MGLGWEYGGQNIEPLSWWTLEVLPTGLVSRLLCHHPLDRSFNHTKSGVTLSPL